MIKSMLQYIPTYIMSLYMLPVGGVHEILKIIRQFGGKEVQDKVLIGFPGSVYVSKRKIED